MTRRIGLATPAKSQRLLALAAQLVGSSLDLDAVVRIALELAVDVMNAERGLLVLRLDRRVAAAYNLDPAKLAGEPGAPAQAIVERVLETGEPIFTTDAKATRAGTDSSRLSRCGPVRSPAFRCACVTT